MLPFHVVRTRVFQPETLNICIPCPVKQYQIVFHEKVFHDPASKSDHLFVIVRVWPTIFHLIRCQRSIPFIVNSSHSNLVRSILQPTDHTFFYCCRHHRIEHVRTRRTSDLILHYIRIQAIFPFYSQTFPTGLHGHVRTHTHVANRSVSGIIANRVFQTFAAPNQSKKYDA